MSDKADRDFDSDDVDLNEPIPAHVEAALRRTDAPYPPPLDELLTLGSALDEDAEERLAALPIAQEHVPDLVRMARDEELNTADDESPAGWAPIHALMALRNLDVTGHVEELVPLFDLDSDWITEELPSTIGRVGETALAPLAAYMSDRTRWIYGRGRAGTSIAEVGKQHPELRERAIQLLTDELEHAAENDPGLNGFFISDLVSLKAVEALPTIRRAFEQELVEEFTSGDWGTVLEALGQTPDPDDPLLASSRRRLEEQQPFLRSSAAPTRQKPAKQSKAAKEKRKRKSAAAARKANKKKKRR